MKLHTGEKRKAKMEQRRVEKELLEIKGSLDEAYRLFDQSLDPALTEAYIYEINALKARYDHLFRSAKTLFF